jgi:hypothetical protein
VVRLVLSWSDGFACLVLGTLFVVMVEGMLLVVVKVEYGWLWRNGKTGNRTHVAPDVYSGAPIMKKAMCMMDNMGV